MEYSPVNDSLTAVDAERGLLGILIRHPDRLEAASDLRQADFSGAVRQGIYVSLEALKTCEGEIPLAVLSAEVKKRTGQDADVEIIDCTGYPAHPGALDKYIRLVKDASARRRGAAIVRRMDERFRDPATDVPRMVSAAIDSLKELFGAGEVLPLTHEVMTDGYMLLDDINSGNRSPMPTGLETLDEEIHGFYPSELTIVGARTGSGKSAFAISAALAAAGRGAKVLFISTEMSREQLGVRLLANCSGVPMSLMRNPGALTPDQWDEMADLLADNGRYPISWLTGERRFEEVLARARAMKARGECDMLIVDYLQQLECEGAGRGEEWLRLGRISMKLKELAVDLKIPVIATAQLNRMNEGESAPGLDSLRGSGSLEQDADNVILMSALPDKCSSVGYDKQYLFDICRARKMKLTAFSISKQRQGTTGRLLAGFDGEHMKFVRL